MTLYEAIVPAIIANLAVVLSFFEGGMISAKVKAELPSEITSLTEEAHGAPSANAIRQPILTERQRGRIEQMCRGVSSMSGFLGNIAILLATAVFALYFVPSAQKNLAYGFLAVTTLLTLFVVYRLAAMQLSDIDERVVLEFPPRRYRRQGNKPFGFTAAFLVKLFLIVMNCIVFFEMAASVGGT